MRRVICRAARCGFWQGLIFIVLSCPSLVPAVAASGTPSARVDHCQMVHVYPHDPAAYTQGLVYVDGHLYESTGRNGQSSVRMVELASGKILQRYDLPKEYFGEGLTEWQGSLIQLTWQTETGFVYDRFSFALRRSFHYRGEVGA
jgi:glutaminyl-peptide cyclotransferase